MAEKKKFPWAGHHAKRWYIKKIICDKKTKKKSSVHCERKCAFFEEMEGFLGREAMDWKIYRLHSTFFSPLFLVHSISSLYYHPKKQKKISSLYIYIYHILLYTRKISPPNKLPHGHLGFSSLGPLRYIPFNKGKKMESCPCEKGATKKLAVLKHSNSWFNSLKV